MPAPLALDRLIVRAGTGPARAEPSSSTVGQGDGYEAVVRLHEDRVDVDAAFVLTDAAATGALRALADLGRDVPGDVQVVGFDNDAEADFMVPRLTTVEPGNDAMAKAIVRVLLDQIRGGRRSPGRGDGVVSPARLVVRESTRARGLP